MVPDKKYLPKGSKTTYFKKQNYPNIINPQKNYFNKEVKLKIF